MNTVTVLHGQIRTMKPGAEVAESIAWSNGRIVAVGTHAEVAAAVPRPTQVIELGERTVIPGLIDAHHHAGISALYGGRLRLDATEITGISSLQQALARAAATLAPGRWLVATHWSEHTLREHRAPTRAELDDAVPDRPMLAMHSSYHRAVANSRALEIANIRTATPDPTGGIIGRARGGEPNGLLIERGMSPLEQLARADLVAFDAEEIVQRLGAHSAQAFCVGLTHVADAAVPVDLIRLYEQAHLRGVARIPTTLMPVSIRGWLEVPTDVIELELEKPKARTLRLGPVKMVFDGAHACAMCLGVWQSAVVFMRTAAISIREGTLVPLRATASMAPRLSRGVIRTGILMYGRAAAAKTVQRAIERGLSVASHAEGNEAIDVVLDAYQAAGSALHAHGNARLKHGIFMTRRHVERLGDSGIAVVVQPAFLTMPEFAHAPAIPGIEVKPLRRLLDAKVQVVGSSDYPVVGFDPMLGIRSAMRRPRVSADQEIGLDEALALYTRTAAEVLGLRDCGTLEAGKRADVVIFDCRLDEASVTVATVATTVLEGEVVFGALSSRV